MRIDVCVDICVLIMNDLQRFGFCFEIKLCNVVLNGCRGIFICNFGVIIFKVIFKDNLEFLKFIIVKVLVVGYLFMIYWFLDCIRIWKY